MTPLCTGLFNNSYVHRFKNPGHDDDEDENDDNDDRLHKWKIRSAAHANQ